VHANLAVKSNSRETHVRVVLVYKLLVTMSLLELGPVIFGGTELNYIKDWVHVVQTRNLHRFAYNRYLRVTVGVD